jgi:monofunctional biosynthetic peptidoglycan transglycosylase
MAQAAYKQNRAKPLRASWIWRVLSWAALAFGVFYCCCLAGLVALKWIHPPTTAVQSQRRIAALLHHRKYQKRYTWVPLGRISRDLQHAVIAGEDTRFYQHHGFDWEEMKKVMDSELERKRLGRGASTITQQLVKNVFLTTNRSILRKGVEALLVPPAEFILGKQRILELYLNLIEWGPGVYGAEAAAGFYYNEPASRVDRDQAARLAAIIPAPLARKPARMNEYSAEILDRMNRMGW